MENELQAVVAEMINAAGAAHAMKNKQKNGPSIDDLQTVLDAFPEVFPDLILVMDAEMVILNYRVGKKADLYTSPEQVLHRRLDQVLPRQVTERVEAAVRACLTHRTIQSVEYSLSLSSGEDYFEARMMPLGADKVMAIVRNVTERVRAEKALRKAEEALKHRLAFEQTVYNVSSKFVGLFDFDQAVDASLAEFGRASGASRVYLFLFNEDRSIMTNTHEWCADGVSPQIDNLQHVPSDAVPWWMAQLNQGKSIQVDDVSKMPAAAQAEKELLESQDIKSLLVLPLYVVSELTGFIGFDNVLDTGIWDPKDINLLRLFSEILSNALERRKAEVTLRESENRFRGLVEQSPFSTVIYAPSGRVVMTNQATKTLFRVSPELYEYVLTQYNVLQDEQLEAKGVMPYIKMAFEGQATSTPGIQYEVPETDTPDLWTQAHIYPVKDEHGKVTHVVLIHEDITERKQHEQERERFIDELETKNAELERFTYTVSHDLKSPLVTIKGFLGLLEKDLAAGKAERVTRDLVQIHSAADKMQQLLGELLELSRIGRQVNTPEAVSLTEVAREAAGLVAGQIEARGVAVEIAPAMPVVFGDRTRLLEVYQNLIDNAVKYMDEEPTPRVEIGARQENGEVVCSVQDNGLGINPEYHEKVFGLFERLKAEEEGTGIGLALVKRIVEVHGGRIWIESEGEGHGSTFYFTLPTNASAG